MMQLAFNAGLAALFGYWLTTSEYEKRWVYLMDGTFFSFNLAMSLLELDKLIGIF
jgi:hypothetical protein